MYAPLSYDLARYRQTESLRESAHRRLTASVRTRPARTANRPWSRVPGRAARR